MGQLESSARVSAVVVIQFDVGSFLLILRVETNVIISGHYLLYHSLVARSFCLTRPWEKKRLAWRALSLQTTLRTDLRQIQLAQIRKTIKHQQGTAREPAWPRGPIRISDGTSRTEHRIFKTARNHKFCRRKQTGIRDTTTRIKMRLKEDGFERV